MTTMIRTPFGTIENINTAFPTPSPSAITTKNRAPMLHQDIKTPADNSKSCYPITFSIARILSNHYAFLESGPIAIRVNDTNGIPVIVLCFATQNGQLTMETFQPKEQRSYSLSFGEQINYCADLQKPLSGPVAAGSIAAILKEEYKSLYDAVIKVVMGRI